ncbi:unnamed protein product [Nippostrongylus brasiliensis]|uniref:Dystrophin n=1 Tax=Nippostrongylus brasiliensis TaxID=27835 RepID=A0A0N4YVB1_NIPBR|nr:unnamed protein product [Nippostrongylus brasiliensis]
MGLLKGGQLDLCAGRTDIEFDETAVELDVDFNPYDMKGIEEAIKVATAKHAQIAEKKTALVQLENAKERLVAQASVDPALKHEVRRGLRSDLVDRQQALAQIKRDCEAFWRNVDDMARRGTDLQRRCQAINDAVIFTPSPDHVLACRSDAAALRNDIADIKQRVQRANAEHVKLGGKSEKKIVTVITTCNTAIQFAAALAEPPVSTDESLHDSSYSQGTVVETRRDGAITQASTAEMVEEEDGALSEEDTIEPEYQGTLESVTGSSSKDDDRPPGMPRLHPRDATSWQSLTQLRHWLNELERDASLTVDLCDRNAIREMTKTVQGIMDHIRAKILDVVGIQDASGAEVVKRKARELVEDMDRVARQCDRRRATLQQLGEQSRVWSSARDAVELWMQQSDELIELEQKKAAINDVNAKGNAMLDTYTRDEAHTLSHELSKLNMKWSKFNDKYVSRVRFRSNILSLKNDVGISIFPALVSHHPSSLPSSPAFRPIYSLLCPANFRLKLY